MPVFLFKDDSHLIIPSGIDPLAEMAMTCNGAFPVTSPNSNEFIFNEPRLHRAVIPAANGISNASSLARIYALLISDIQDKGEKTTCLLSQKTSQLATENVTPPNEPDRILFGLTTKFARGGFELCGDVFKVLGEDGFGHRGEISSDV